MVTIDLILQTLEDWVSSKTPISAHTWLDSAQKITTLMGNEHEEYFKMAQNVAKMRLEARKTTKTVADANLIIDASDELLALNMKGAKIKRIEEIVRIAKKQATLADTEMRLQ
jgi:hypothetical protein